MNQQELHILFSQVIGGISSIFDPKLGYIYIKHSNQFDSLLIQREYSKYYEEAISKGLPTYSQREKFIINEGIWSQEKENKIKENKQFIDAMTDKLSREYLYSRRKLYKKEIADVEKNIDKLLIEKNFHIGNTVEQFAAKQSFYLQIKLSLYKDETLKDRFINEDINYEEKYDELASIYDKSLSLITQDSLKRIAISSFFNTMFSICGDNAYYFYGKPIINLTTYQTELFLWGRYFRNLLSQYGNDIPPSMSKNPDDMMEFFEIRENTKKSKVLDGGDENTTASSPVGATREDMRLMGVDDSQIRDIGKDIRKAGGFVGRDELYKIRG